jgi:opacity protein-like surface antigen
MRERRVAIALLALACAPVPAVLAQGPPPPPSSSAAGAGPVYHELLPDVGRIGAEVGVLAGVSWNPYEVGTGAEVGGFIDLPLARVPGGKLSYEILLALDLGTSPPFTVAGAGGPASVQTRLRLLQAAPFSLKYAFIRSPASRLRPYLVAGADAFLSDVRDHPEPPQDSARAARGLPSAGTTSLALGAHAGAGVEVRLSSGLSTNLEYRYARFEGHNASLHTLGGALGVHW